MYIIRSRINYKILLKTLEWSSVYETDRVLICNSYMCAQKILLSLVTMCSNHLEIIKLNKNNKHIYFEYGWMTHANLKLSFKNHVPN